MARQQRPKTNNILKLGIPSTGLSAAAYTNRLNEDFVSKLTGLESNPW